MSVFDTPSSLCITVFMILLFIVGFVYQKLVLTFTYWKRRGVECVANPVSLPILRRFCNTLFWGYVDLDAINVLYQTMGDRPYGGVYIVTQPVLVVKDPDLIRRIFTKDFQHFVDLAFVSNKDVDSVGKSLIHLKGREWKAAKPRLSAQFTPMKVYELAVPTIVRCCDNMLTVMGENARDERPVEVVDLCRRYGIDCFTGAYLGVNDVSTVLDEHCELATISRQFIRTHYIRHVFFGSVYPELYRLLKMRVTTKPVGEFFQMFTKKLVAKRRERGRFIYSDDFIQTLIDMKDEYDRDCSSDKDKKSEYNLVVDDFFMVGQMFVFFIAGYETTAKTLAFCLYEVAVHPNIQQKVRDEAQRVLGEHKGSVITDQMLHDLKYTWQVISEALRKYPVFSIAFRRCTQDYKIPDTDVIIEKETLVLIPRYAIHWDSKHFPHPERFDPERFNEENEHKRNPGIFIPFGTGPRNCSGMSLATAEMKILLAKILLNYEITLNEKTNSPLQYDPTEFILTPKDGVFLNVRKLKT